jgi:DNA-binding transcriptional MerR regulator
MVQSFGEAARARREKMLKIGDFSRISQVSVKTLRYYDEIGLFRPAMVDRSTGYRYYSEEQLPQLNRILALKDLGLSLDQIARMLDDDLSTVQIWSMLRLKQMEIQQCLEEDQARLARVEARMRQVEQVCLESKNQEEDTTVRTCPECGKRVRELAPGFCPHCGVSLSAPSATLLPIQKPTGQLVKRLAIPLLVTTAFVVVISSFVHLAQSGRDVAPSLMSGPISESRPPDAQLALLSVRSGMSEWGRHFVFEGQVKNISDSSLQNIAAVVTVYDANPSRIASDVAPIDVTTLLPGQTSLFKVMIDDTPQAEYYKVTFKHMDGGTIPTRTDKSG